MTAAAIAVFVAFLSMGVFSDSAHAASECGNESLRAELASQMLPDCRAYEMVSPAYKATASVNVFAVASTGDQVVGMSQGAFSNPSGEAEEAIFNAVYLFKRGLSGWTATPMNPSNVAFPGQAFADAEPDSGSSLWLLHTPTQSALTTDAYIRRADGSTDEIGPLLPPEATVGPPSQKGPAPSPAVVAGATRDYGTIVIRDEGTVGGVEAHWPFDKTKRGWSLYDYQGTGNSSPSLVGVSGGAGSTTLISECGTALGSSGEKLAGSAYNALSSDGRIIYFTPGPADNEPCEGAQPAVAEVFARVSNTSTVNVSSPPPAECDATCEASTPRDKHYEGASEDGTKAFFTSTQALLTGASEDAEPEDSASRAGCAVTIGAGGCNLYSYEIGAPAGSRFRLIAGDAEVLGTARIAESGASVYFVARKAAFNSVAGPLDFTADGAEEGGNNLYVYRTASHTVQFVAALPESDSELWGMRDTRPVQTSPDGRYLLFPSTAHLTPDVDEATSTEQLYLYDAVSGEIVRASIGENGYQDNGNVPGLAVSTLEEKQSEYQFSSFHRLNNSAHDMTDNGEVVTFQSRARLAPRAFAGDVNCSNVYEYRRNGEGTAGELHLISDGNDVQNIKGAACGAVFSSLAPDASSIFFTTADPLIATDSDGQRDIYDARVLGGFPVPQAPASCFGEGCHGPASAAPALQSAVSGGLAGEPPLPAPVAGVAPKLTLTAVRALAAGVKQLKVKVPGKGKLTVSGNGLSTRSVTAKGAVTLTIQARLGPKARSRLAAGHAVRVQAKLKYVMSDGSTLSLTRSVMFARPRSRKGR
jgi:hypothetical protein